MEYPQPWEACMRVAAFLMLVGAVGLSTAQAEAASILPGNFSTITNSPAAVTVLTAAGFVPGTAGTATSGMVNGQSVAFLPITGGFTNPDGTEQVDHAGTILTLVRGTETTTIENLVVDTAAEVVDANVSANGVSLAPVAVPVYDIGAGGALTFTAGSVSALNAAYGIDAFSTTAVTGTLAINPIVASTIPEPPTLALLGLGVLGLYGLRRNSI